MPDETITKNGLEYSGPHKYIVCILGSESYSAMNFEYTNKDKIKSTKNLSISIMTLSTNRLYSSNVKDYIRLTQHTPEGCYLNVTNHQKGDRLIERFYSTMEVYPTGKIPMVREYFQNA